MSTVSGAHGVIRGWGRAVRFTAFAACALLPSVLRAQVTGAPPKRDSSAAPRADSARTRPTPALRRVPVSSARLSPPLSPRRAFVYSAILPGYGQTRLDRGTSGALFASVELAAFAMIRQSQADLREAQRYRIDTLPSDFSVNGTTITKVGTFTNKYTEDLVRARKLHVEDWIALIAFNHLFAGADAFVSAQLWDVPVTVSLLPTSRGPTATLALRW